MAQHNPFVSQAVERAINRIDDFISGARIKLPVSDHRRACDDLLGQQAASVRTAVLFLMCYWLEDPAWDRDSIPVGLRGKYGDKRLCEALTVRQITLHDAITAFGENLGWKGNVRNVRLSRDPRFHDFLTRVADAEPAERNRIADYLAQRFAESKRESTPLPPVGPDLLIFARARKLFYNLLQTSSEGHIQQFLIAALLHEYRRRHGVDVITHHPHAADKYDDTAGDIEERFEGRLIRAYEVTVRADWQNRLSNFQRKMNNFELSKYVIIAAGVNDDMKWAVPAEMALALEPYGRDITVVGLRDIVNFLTAELTPEQLRSAVNLAYEYLSDRKLCGREAFKDVYKQIVSGWLDTMNSE